MTKAPVLPLTSIRFFLIAYIAIAHFIRFATVDETILKLFSQQNLVVGAFFVLSGYIMAYVYTEFHSTEVRPIQPLKFIMNRLARMYPAYFFILLIFSPMFIYVDLYYGNGIYTLWHALVVLTLTQAWFPTLGELWNSPTWFLSASLFAYVLFPYIIAPIAKLNRKGLYKFLFTTIATSLLIKVIYSNISGWAIMEGMKLPNPAWYFNFVRFNPVINLFEFLMGIATARLMMTSESKDRSYFPGIILACLVAVMALRVPYTINDMIVRTAVFIPLFLIFLTHLHKSEGYLSKVLSHPFLVYLGEISFSIYIVHGAIGQLFYKKAVKSLFFSEPISIFIFYASVMASAVALYHLVEKPAQNAIKKRLQIRSAPDKA
ncbi:MAG: peptidoglycan/LPS O-acetylase OafA/YrhL [Chlamydiales bacterium]|jgi:peptidoglycan/LPS O-acetylase OafA/YrhL